jgi:hypothetical protein
MNEYDNEKENWRILTKKIMQWLKKCTVTETITLTFILLTWRIR